MNPSTKNLHLIPNPVDLKRICKAYAALEAILIPDRIIRNSSYNKDHGEAMELFDYHLDPAGTDMAIVFGEQGTCIVGFYYECDLIARFEEAHLAKEELERKKYKWWMLKKFKPTPVWEIYYDAVNLPEEIEKLMEESVIDRTSFCAWQTKTDAKWQKGRISASKIELNEDVSDLEDGSDFFLRDFDGNPVTVKNTLNHGIQRDLDMKTIEKVVNGEAITKEMAQKLNPEHQDFEKLKSDLDEIGFPYQL